MRTIAVLLLMTGLAGCAEERTVDPIADPAGTNLTVTLDPDGARGPGSPRSWTLTCDPPGGTHPKPQDACERVGTGLSFSPPPRDQMCTEIYGGPQVATVTGYVRAVPVSASFSREDGCAIARWEDAGPLLAALAAGTS